MFTAYIGLGSNLNNPQQQIVQACSEIADLEDVRLVRMSSLYRSSPMGPMGQPDYVNAVAEIATNLTPESLLNELQRIENEHGRTRNGIRWGARTLDLDVLIYGEEVINTKTLTIPHPGLYERAFVLYPLKEIAPDDLRIPGHGKLAGLVSRCERGDLELISTVSLNNNDKQT